MTMTMMINKYQGLFFASDFFPFPQTMSDLIFVFTTIFEKDITYDEKCEELHIVKNFDLFKYPPNSRKLFYRFFTSLRFAEPNFTTKELIECMRKDDSFKFIPTELATHNFITSCAPHQKLLEEDYVFINECPTLTDRMHHLPRHVAVYAAGVLNKDKLEANYIHYLQTNLISLNKQVIEACNSELIAYLDDETILKVLDDTELFNASDKKCLIERLYDKETNLCKINDLHTHSKTLVKFIPFNIPFFEELLETLTFIDVPQNEFVAWFETIDNALLIELSKCVKSAQVLPAAVAYVNIIMHYRHRQPYTSMTLLVCSDAANVHLFDLTIPELFLYVAQHMPDCIMRFLRTTDETSFFRDEGVRDWVINNVFNNAILYRMLLANDRCERLVCEVCKKHSSFGMYWLEREIEAKNIDKNNFEEAFEKYATN